MDSARGGRALDETAPDLIVIAGCDANAFAHLMRSGKALGERECGICTHF
jgi:hypothetical protein